MQEIEERCHTWKNTCMLYKVSNSLWQLHTLKRYNINLKYAQHKKNDINVIQSLNVLTKVFIADSLLESIKR
jgi:hypothetical protein